jgi:hypothetical protein
MVTDSKTRNSLRNFFVQSKTKRSWSHDFFSFGVMAIIDEPLGLGC